MIIMFLSPKVNKEYNVNIWKLSNGVIVKYYEMKEGGAGFTANISQYLLVTGDARSYKKYYVGIGGSHKKLELFASQNKNIVWLKGTESRFKEPNIIAAINLSNNIFIDKYRLLWKKEDLTKNEIALIDSVKSEQGEHVRRVH